MEHKSWGRKKESGGDEVHSVSQNRVAFKMEVGKLRGNDYVNRYHKRENCFLGDSAFVCPEYF